MKFDLEKKRNRRSIRLKAYDYSQAGAYFVTICAQNRECLFGRVLDSKMVFNDTGQMIKSAWDELPRHYPGIDIDAFAVMPNHIHGIIVINDTDVGAGPRACPENGQPQGVAPTMSLPDVVHRFKSFTNACYRHHVTENGWPPFNGQLWQRNYYEHIIRNEEELGRIRQYIADNPLQWHVDRENPATANSDENKEEPWRANA